MSESDLNSKDLAKRWGLHEGTLANWRFLGRGPKYFKTGRFVKYKLEDIIKYENDNTFDPSWPLEVIMGEVCEVCREEFKGDPPGYPQMCKNCANEGVM